jgi:uncharacterized membrane protein YfcA
VRTQIDFDRGLVILVAAMLGGLALVTWVTGDWAHWIFGLLGIAMGLYTLKTVRL